MDKTAALIAASATLVTAAVAYSGFLISKDLKTTEFRQSWIDDQRADLSVVIAEAQALARERGKRKRETSLRAFDEAAARIILRENPKKKEWEKPLANIAFLRSQLEMPVVTVSQVLRLVTSISTEAQELLKIEWDRVRAGEDSYQTSRTVAKWFGATAFVAMIMLFWAIGYGNGFIVVGWPH